MPTLDSTILEKISDLRAKTFSWQETPVAYQLVRIDWQDGEIYYSAKPVDEMSPTLPVSPVEARLVSDSPSTYFLPIGGDSTLGDKEIDLEFWDGGGSDFNLPNLGDAGSFADLVEANGEGIKSEVFFWFPQVDLLLSVWTGHLRNDESSDAVIWRGKIANGFRSPNLPMPGRAHYGECQAIYGKLLDTQEEIDASGCPHNAHIGGLIGNNLHATCPRRTTADCVARGVPPEYHLSHQTISVTVLNRQTSGGNLYSVSRGNETNLKKPVRVVMGKRRIRDCEVLAYARHYNNNNPDHGFFEAIYELCEGSVQNVYSAYFVVDGNTQWANPQHYSFRPGYAGQAPLSADRLTPHGYSLTAIMRYNFGWVNPGNVDQSQCRGSAIVEGLNTMRVYDTPTTFTTTYSTSRVWQIAKALTDRIWGHGWDYARFGLQSWIDSASWNIGCTFTSPEGAVHSYSRGESNVELNERSTQQQIEDMCLAGRLSRPYLFAGKYHITPIRALTNDELAACPVFTDVVGASGNILYSGDGDKRQSTLKRSKKSDLDLPNRIEATFDEAAGDYLEATAQPIEDVGQQLKAGRVQGDHTRRKVTKKYSFLGVTEKDYVAMLMHWLLWFGEFGEGGIKNNLEIKFDCFFLDALSLHEFKVIKVESSQLVRYGFEYFQIKKISYQSNLHVSITAQAFNQTALSTFETVYIPPDPGGNPGDPPIVIDPPQTPNPICNLTFGEIKYTENVLEVPINPC